MKATSEGYKIHQQGNRQAWFNKHQRVWYYRSVDGAGNQVEHECFTSHGPVAVQEWLDGARTTFPAPDILSACSAAWALPPK